MFHVKPWAELDWFMVDLGEATLARLPRWCRRLLFRCRLNFHV